MEIIPNVHLIPGVSANPYLIIDTDGLTVIDTGVPAGSKKILSYMASVGRAPGDLKRILITHSDYDHVGGLAALKQATGARMYASPIEAKAIATGRASRELNPDNALLKLLLKALIQMMKATPVQVDGYLAEGQVLPGLGGLRVVETPGHTPGHISLFAPSVGILFVGDSIVVRKNRMVGSVKANTWDMNQAHESVLKQAALGARIVCSGHGPVVMEAAGKFPV